MQERLARIEQLFTRDKLRTAEVLTLPAQGQRP